jgi:hypothetical protein
MVIMAGAGEIEAYRLSLAAEEGTPPSASPD